MATSDEKLNRFVQAITAYANEQKDTILREVDAYKSTVLAKAEEEVMRESSAMIEEERKELLADLSREMSDKETAARRALLAKRQALMEQVFTEAAERVRAFTDTPDYAALLARSFADIRQRLTTDGTVFYVRQADLTAVKALDSSATVREDKNITLGGIRAENDAAGLQLDDTLDTRLSGQKDWFLTHSGLTIQQGV